MGDKTGIEWTDGTWNPLIGCSLKSTGCQNCYAMKVAHRFQSTHKHYKGTTKLTSFGPHWTGLVNQAPGKILTQPLRWTRPRFIFVNSMSDLFHETVPFEFIAAVFGIMAACPQHVFQVLTKRPERAVEFFAWLEENKKYSSPNWFIGREAKRLLYSDPELGEENVRRFGERLGRAQAQVVGGGNWPLKNVWMGTSVENQKTADVRIPLLMLVPTVVRWISAEPLLGPVDLTNGRENRWTMPTARDANGRGIEWTDPGPGYLPLDWVVVGGESGPGARPMASSWAESILDQCKRAEVPLMMKQWGDWVPHSGSLHIGSPAYGVTLPLQGETGQLIDVSGNWRNRAGKHITRRQFQWAGTGWTEKVGKKVAGRELRGQHWDEYPKERFATKASAAA